jgi:hypothetical protein
MKIVRCRLLRHRHSRVVQPSSEGRNSAVLGWIRSLPDLKRWRCVSKLHRSTASSFLAPGPESLGELVPHPALRALITDWPSTMHCTSLPRSASIIKYATCHTYLPALEISWALRGRSRVFGCDGISHACSPEASSFMGADQRETLMISAGADARRRRQILRCLLGSSRGASLIWFRPGQNNLKKSALVT